MEQVYMDIFVEMENIEYNYWEINYNDYGWDFCDE